MPIKILLQRHLVIGNGSENKEFKHLGPTNRVNRLGHAGHANGRNTAMREVVVESMVLERN